MKYKIYQIYLSVKYKTGIVKHSVIRNIPKLETLKEVIYEFDNELRYVVLLEDEINNYIKQKYNKELLKSRISEHMLYKNFILNEDYHFYGELEILENKIKYKEIDFNNRKIAFWKDNLQTKDLMIILNQENLDILKILKD